MSRDLASGTLSTELYSDTDRIFDGATVPQNTSLVSSVFEFGKTLDALELVGAVETEIVIAAATAMTITLAWDEDPAGAFSDTQEVFTTGPGTITAGTELFRYVADHLKPVYYKATVATTDAAATGAVDVNIGSVRK